MFKYFVLRIAKMKLVTTVLFVGCLAIYAHPQKEQARQQVAGDKFGTKVDSLNSKLEEKPMDVKERSGTGRLMIIISFSFTVW